VTDADVRAIDPAFALGVLQSLESSSGGALPQRPKGRDTVNANHLQSQRFGGKLVIARREIIRTAGIASLGVSSLMLPSAANAASLFMDVVSGFDVGPLSVGEEGYGGYFAGVIDTRGKQSGVADYAFSSQGGVSYDQGFVAAPSGKRYAVIVSPRSHTPTTATAPFWRGNDGTGFVQGLTRWDGRYATQHVIANLALANFPLFRFARDVNANAFAANGSANGVTITGGAISTAAPDDGGSPWYIPAMDELELLYRVFKPTGDQNFVSAADPRGATSFFWKFPGTEQSNGRNPSAAVATGAYTSAVPAQTSVAAFQAGGSEALGSGTAFRLWSSTINDVSLVSAWNQDFGTAEPGKQQTFGTPQALQGVRLIRRIEF